jgi:hypothetical protein
MDARSRWRPPIEVATRRSNRAPAVGRDAPDVCHPEMRPLQVTLLVESTEVDANRLARLPGGLL